MPDVTSQRLLPYTGNPWTLKWVAPSINQFGTDASFRLGMSALPSQLTTSFRTGRAGAVPDEEIIPTSHEQAFKTYKDELRQNPQSSVDTGHEFWTYKTWRSTSHPGVKLTAAGFPGRVYTGPLWIDIRLANPVNASYPVPERGIDSYYGTRAIALTAPTNPVANLANALGELYRDGLPSRPGAELMRSRKDFEAKLASEHLNIEFAWKPLINDVRATAHAVIEHKRLLAQYAKDSGKNIRRRCSFAVPTVVEDRTDGGGRLVVTPPITDDQWQSLFITTPAGGTVPMSEHVETERSIWFSGAYTYHLPQGDELMDKLARFEQKANQLLGTRLTPDVLWNLAPWSWLVDWQWNIGDNIKNATNLAADGLVIRWGYIMCTTKRTRTLTLHGIRDSAGNPLGPISNTFVTISKERLKATPFGFGQNPNSFTERQWSILAALGMTKGHRKQAW